MGLWLQNFRVSVLELSNLISRLNWLPIFVLFGLLVGHVALSAWRWSIIEAGLGGTRPSFRDAYIAGAIAMGLGTILPSVAVNIASRGVANRVRGASGLRGALSGGIDQSADLFVILLLVIPALFSVAQKDLRVFLIGALIMLIAGTVVILSLPTILQKPALLRRIPQLGRVMPLTRWPLLVKIYGISLLRVGNLTLMTISIHFACGAASVPAVIMSVPLVTVAIVAAMLPGGVGISEWSFSAVFTVLGVSRDEIVVFSLTNRILLTALPIVLMVIAMFAVLARPSKRNQCT
jgi:uncharacterized membrane protein YbhN (UPF0104 family)